MSNLVQARKAFRMERNTVNGYKGREQQVREFKHSSKTEVFHPVRGADPAPLAHPRPPINLSKTPEEQGITSQATTLI